MGVHVPPADRRNHGYVLNPRRVQKFPGAMQRLREDLLEAERAGARFALLSAEVVAHLSGDQLTEIREGLKPWQVTPLLILRRWEESLISRYAQNILAGDWQGLPAWVASLTTKGQRHPDADFAFVVQRLRQAFGRVHVAPYESDAALQLLQTVVGSYVSVPGSVAPISGRNNQRLGWKERETLRFVNSVVGGALGRAPDAKNEQARGRDGAYEPMLLRRWLEAARAAAFPWVARLEEQIVTSRRDFDFLPLQLQINTWNAALQGELALPDVISHGDLSGAHFAEFGQHTAEPWSDLPERSDAELAAEVLHCWRSFSAAPQNPGQ